MCIAMPCRYKVINFQLSQRIQATPTNCENILKRADLQDWAMGFTKVQQIRTKPWMKLYALATYTYTFACIHTRFSSSITMWITLTSYCQSLKGQQSYSSV